MLPSGLRWCDLHKGGGNDGTTVQVGQVVRVDYIARLDDGTRIAGGTSSFRLGAGAVCAAIDEVVPGMRLGDTRRVRAPPHSPRGRALASAPRNEMLEYDVVLTGIVNHMRIVTLEDERASDDPLDQVVEFGRRSLARLVGLATARPTERGERGGGDGKQ